MVPDDPVPFSCNLLILLNLVLVQGVLEVSVKVPSEHIPNPLWDLGCEVP